MTYDEAVIARDAAKTAWMNALKSQRVSQGDSAVQYQSVADLYKQYMDLERIVTALMTQSAGASRPLASTARWTR